MPNFSLKIVRRRIVEEIAEISVEAPRAAVAIAKARLLVEDKSVTPQDLGRAGIRFGKAPAQDDPTLGPAFKVTAYDAKGRPIVVLPASIDAAMTAEATAKAKAKAGATTKKAATKP